MNCKSCGAEIPDGTIFCYNCGTKVEPEISHQKTQEKPISNKKSFNLFDNKHIGKLKESSSNISKSTKGFVENTGNTIVNTFKHDDEVKFKKYGYEESLNYIRRHHSTKIAFPASDDETKDKWNQLLNGEVIGTGVGLVGAAATIGLIGTTLGAGLIVVGAGALIGGVLASNYERMSWVLADLFIEDDELIISGKFSIHFDEIKHVSTKIYGENELVVLTLKEQAIEFKTYNAKALKTIIEKKKWGD